jgi:hypothetical protein
MPKRSPSAKQVILQAQRVVALWMSDGDLVDALADLKRKLERFNCHSNMETSLMKIDQRLAMKKEGAIQARKQFVDAVRHWELSGRTIGQLIFELRTMPINID